MLNKGNVSRLEEKIGSAFLHLRVLARVVPTIHDLRYVVANAFGSLAELGVRFLFAQEASLLVKLGVAGK